jgi:DNA invertase Pin-like site-specific DNA recombinase
MTKSEGLQVIGYTRLSRAGNGHGLDAQRQAIVEHCERMGWQLVAVLSDEAASGRSMRKRPGLLRCIESCIEGSADAIVSSKVDRLARSSLDFHRIIEQAQKHGFDVVCVEQGFSLQTPEGRLLASILASFAQFERELIGARTRAGLEIARAKGKKIGNPNFARASDAAVQRIKELRAQGLNFSSIANQLAAEGIETAQHGARWYGNTVARIVHRLEAER